MTLPKVGETFLAEVGTDSTHRVALLDRGNNEVYECDENGVPVIGGRYSLPDFPVDKNTQAVTSLRTTSTAIAQQTDGTRNVPTAAVSIDVVNPLGAATGWQVPIEGPNGLMFPHYDGEGVVRMYRKTADGIVEDAEYIIGAISDLPGGRDVYRYCGCYYTAANGSTGYLYALSSFTRLGYGVLARGGLRYTLFRASSHNSAGVSVGSLTPSSLYDRSVISMKQIGASGNSVQIAITMYNAPFDVRNNVQFTTGLAGPGAVFQSRGVDTWFMYATQGNDRPGSEDTRTDPAPRQGVIIRALPVTAVINVPITGGTTSLLYSRSYPTPVPQQVGSAYGNFAWEQNNSVLSIPGNGLIPRRLYRAQISEGHVTLHRTQFNPFEFSNTVNPPLSVIPNNSSLDEDIISSPRHASIDTVWSCHYRVAAGKKTPLRLNVLSMDINSVRELYDERQTNLPLVDTRAELPRVLGFTAAVEGDMLSELGDYWEITYRGVKYQPRSISQRQDNRAIVEFVQS